ncbi:MAG: 1,4-alpha-glucan branching protein GlgB [Gammaproteobacteria bacterium]
MNDSKAMDIELQRVIEARHHDPFMVLGPHRHAGRAMVRAFLPNAKSVALSVNGKPMLRFGETSLFQWEGSDANLAQHYDLHWVDAGGRAHVQCDPYSFNPLIPQADLELFGRGKHRHAYNLLGARLRTVDGMSGTLFATWAPNAERVSVVGDFNDWDGRRLPMRVRGSSGVWELFVPGVTTGTLYKFEIRNRDHGMLHLKADPYARRAEYRPGTASIVAADNTYAWSDAGWTGKRPDWLHAPISVYEVHLGSWRRDADGRYLGYSELAQQLVEHAKQGGFTHIELMPVMEHPLDMSWGYQTTGYYAPTSRFGTPDDFRYFVDYCHTHGIGVLLDWAPGHFPKDAHGLASFDGSAVYEHADWRRGEHREWGTLVFNYQRNEVRSFLISNALYWLQEFHIDGLRVDAVSSMLYLDYARKVGEWLPNIHGGNENLEAIEFLQELNAVTHGECPGTVTIAEESTAWPQVTRPTWVGGLGFSMKWNMGWMHDTLAYMSKDPVYRHFHHDILTFGLLYAFNENFVLPFSHDEVVHGKGSLFGKMPGDEWQKFANLRLLFSYMYTYPGKKHLFMGCEFGVRSEWNYDKELEWGLLQSPSHAGVFRLIGDLNRLYRLEGALYQHDFEPQGFDWIDCHDATNSVISYVRRDGDDFVLVILNFTPVPRYRYRIGVPRAGLYRELLNSDSVHYQGSNLGNGGRIESRPQAWMGQPHCIELTLPPLAGLILKPSRS